jgi:hypothetical protein
LLGSLLTLAVNCCVPPDCTEAEVGAMEIVMPVTEMFAEPDLLPSVAEVAVRVTAKLPAGGVDGAV